MKSTQRPSSPSLGVDEKFKFYSLLQGENYTIKKSSKSSVTIKGIRIKDIKPTRLTVNLSLLFGRFWAY